MRPRDLGLPLESPLVPVVAMFVVVEHVMLGWTVPADSWQQHSRSPMWALLVTAMVLMLLLVRRISAGCWLIVGGAAGNLLSWTGDGTVPNYLTVAVADRWLAFNLADIAIVVGLLTVLASLGVRAEFRLRR